MRDVLGQDKLTAFTFNTEAAERDLLQFALQEYRAVSIKLDDAAGYERVTANPVEATL